MQIQFIYLNYNDDAVQSRKVYETAAKHGKPVIVMEPVKGESLVNLPPNGRKILDELHGGSNASYAIRFAAGFDLNRVVLLGMSTFDQMKDNVSFMKEFKSLSDSETDALVKVVDSFHELDLIPCTACHYCVEENHCPSIYGFLNSFPA